jgi:hypothetical protein
MLQDANVPSSCMSAYESPESQQDVQELEPYIRNALACQISIPVT